VIVLALVAIASAALGSSLPSAALGARCDRAAARHAVFAFTKAFREGRIAEVDRLWAREPAFEWYSTSAPGERFRAESKRRETLRGYFSERIAHRERLRITKYRSAPDTRRNLWHFHGRLLRSADDLKTRGFSFKGAATCRTGVPRLIVWSMGSEGGA